MSDGEFVDFLKAINKFNIDLSVQCATIKIRIAALLETLSANGVSLDGFEAREARLMADYCDQMERGVDRVGELATSERLRRLLESASGTKQ